MLIEINGTLCDYCNKCPHMELEVIAKSMDGYNYYACANQGLCAQLWEYLQRTTRESFTASTTTSG